MFGCVALERCERRRVHAFQTDQKSTVQLAEPLHKVIDFSCDGFSRRECSPVDHWTVTNGARFEHLDPFRVYVALCLRRFLAGTRLCIV